MASEVRGKVHTNSLSSFSWSLPTDEGESLNELVSDAAVDVEVSLGWRERGEGGGHQLGSGDSAR